MGLSDVLADSIWSRGCGGLLCICKVASSLLFNSCLAWGWHSSGRGVFHQGISHLLNPVPGLEPGALCLTD